MWYCLLLLECFVFAICCVCKLGKFQITCPKVQIIFSLVARLASLLDFIFIL